MRHIGKPHTYRYTYFDREREIMVMDCSLLSSCVVSQAKLHFLGKEKSVGCVEEYRGGNELYTLR
jgi:hypothetical protein